MLVSEDDDKKIEEQVNKWINDFDFFQIEALLCKFENAKFSKKFKMYEEHYAMKKIKSLNKFSNMLRRMKENSDETDGEIEHQGGIFSKTLKKMKEIFDETGGEIEQQKFFMELEHLTPEITRIMLKECFPRICETKEGYFKDTESIELPEGFKEKMNNAERKLKELKFTVDQNNLNLVLSLEYGENICKKYKLEDINVFNKFKEKLRWRNKN